MIELTTVSTDVTVTVKGIRKMTRNDVFERLTKCGSPNELFAMLAYMKRFQTWAALYDDLERMEAARSLPAVPEVRNVTPVAPKLLAE